MNKMVNLKEAAQMLGVSRETLRQLVIRGVLTPEENPINRREKVIPREQVEALAEKYGRG